MAPYVRARPTHDTWRPGVVSQSHSRASQPSQPASQRASWRRHAEPDLSRQTRRGQHTRCTGKPAVQSKVGGGSSHAPQCSSAAGNVTARVKVGWSAILDDQCDDLLQRQGRRGADGGKSSAWWVVAAHWHPRAHAAVQWQAFRPYSALANACVPWQVKKGRPRRKGRRHHGWHPR